MTRALSVSLLNSCPAHHGAPFAEVVKVHTTPSPLDFLLPALGLVRVRVSGRHALGTLGCDGPRGPGGFTEEATEAQWSVSCSGLLRAAEPETQVCRLQVVCGSQQTPAAFPKEKKVSPLAALPNLRGSTDWRLTSLEATLQQNRTGTCF